MQSVAPGLQNPILGWGDKKGEKALTWVKFTTLMMSLRERKCVPQKIGGAGNLASTSAVGQRCSAEAALALLRKRHPGERRNKPVIWAEPFDDE